MAIRVFIIIALIVFFSTSCIKEEDYPVIPQIEYLDFTKIQNDSGKDDKGILKFSFTDGDGDLGIDSTYNYPPFDSASEYYYNCFIKYFEKRKGVITEVNLPFANNSRLPVLTPNGHNKTLKGEIEITLYINNPVSIYDTILFEAYIVDRALNKSNVIRTPEIVVDKN